MKLHNNIKEIFLYFLNSLKKEESEDSVIINLVEAILSEQDKAQAEAIQKLDEIIANSKNSNALFLRGYCYRRSIGSQQDYTQALKCFEASSHDNAFIQWGLGRMFEEGEGVAKDLKKAYEWYKNAASKEHALAQDSLGAMYANGLGVEKDEKIACEWYTKSANQGNASAQNRLGWMHKSGFGVGKDDKIACGWYTKSANQGNADAQSNLGLMYASGRGVEKDEKIACEWYAKAVIQGNAFAQGNLGWMYENGFGVAKDDKIAYAWYAKAANQGNASAQNRLGWMYANGLGVERNDKLACEWYAKAVIQGNAWAQNRLGWMYANGFGVEKNDKIACEWYLKGANQENAFAQGNLGWMYENGFGVAKDDKIAYAWYAKAANQGNASAQNNLGLMYASGRGVEKDDKLACECYVKAADQGNVLAQSNLGWMYANGRGVEKDDKIACEWYAKAAALGEASAQGNLGLMYASGRGVEKNDKIACEWFTKAAAQGKAIAQFYLAWMYGNGLGVEKDLKIADEWLQKSAAQNNNTAQFILTMNAFHPQVPEQNHPILWKVALHRKWGVLEDLLNITTDKLNSYPTEDMYKNLTILSFAASAGQWILVIRCLEILKNYPVNHRNLDTHNLQAARPGITGNECNSVLSYAVQAGQDKVVTYLLQLGASIDNCPEIYNATHTKAHEYLKAAKDAFSLIENHSKETKEKAEITSERLNTALKFLGKAVNARKNGLTVLELALEKDNQQAIEMLVSHGAELPSEKVSEPAIIKAFRKLAEIKKYAETFEVLMNEHEREKKAKRSDEEKLKDCHQRLNIAGKRIEDLGNEILNLSGDFQGIGQSQVCYELGILLNNFQPHFRDLIDKSLKRVKHDKQNVEKANSILYHLKLSEVDLGAYKGPCNMELGGLEEEGNQNILDFVIKSGTQLDPKILAHHLSSTILGIDGLKIPLDLSEETLTREEVLVATLRECQKQISQLREDQKQNFERKINTETADLTATRMHSRASQPDQSAHGLAPVVPLTFKGPVSAVTRKSAPDNQGTTLKDEPPLKKARTKD